MEQHAGEKLQKKRHRFFQRNKLRKGKRLNRTRAHQQQILIKISQHQELGKKRHLQKACNKRTQTYQKQSKISKNESRNQGKGLPDNLLETTSHLQKKLSTERGIKNKSSSAIPEEESGTADRTEADANHTRGTGCRLTTA